ncbi:MAG: DUF4956 domain-containing protein [Acidobacteriota bacterium]
MPDLSSFLLRTGEVVAAGSMAASFAVALVCGLMMSWLYRYTYRGASYSIAFTRSLVTLTMITAIVIMVIGNNLARAFGLVGAMSIVRFRTAVKDAQDLVFIFFSLAVGLAAGVGLHLLAAAGTLSVGAVILVMSKLNYGSTGRGDLVIQFAMTTSGAEPAVVYGPVLERYCVAFHLLGARAGTAGELDLTFYARLTDPRAAPELAASISALPRVTRVNVFHDEEPE